MCAANSGHLERIVSHKITQYQKVCVYLKLADTCISDYH